MQKRAKFAAMVAVAASAALVLGACGSSGNSADKGDGGSSSGDNATLKAVSIGTTDQVVSLDPAGSYDNGSLMLEVQLYQFLMSVPAQQNSLVPDAAESCDFTDDGQTYTCTLKKDLKFSNGDPLTAEDVAFSFQRVVDIDDPNGPSSLLGNMAKVEAKDDLTVVFTLNNANDQTFPFVLGTSAGPIVNKNVFPADGLLEDAKVIGSGPYSLNADAYSKNKSVTLVPNKNYNGNGGDIKNGGVTLTYFSDASNLKLAVEKGEVDVAWRSLDAESISDLRTKDSVNVIEGPGGEDRYIVFNLKTMPGDTPAQQQAIRRAIAYSIDREVLADKVYQGLYEPAYSMIPKGLPGQIDAFKDEFGAKPDKDAAAKELADAGVSTPVTLPIQYNPDHYGSASADEYGEVKSQLEATGLFTVNLQSTEWTTYNAERVKDAYAIYQLGWFPDFPDADTYLTPFLIEGNFVGAHYCDKGETDRPCDQDDILKWVTQEQTQGGDARIEAIEEIQKISAQGIMPTLPLLQGKQIAVAGKDVTGVADTLDAAFQFRFWVIGKN